jgi:hypothetical protein
MMLLAEMELNVASLVFMGAALLVSGILLMRTQRYFARQSRSRPSPAEFAAPAPKPASSSAELPGDLGRWEVGMHETARELSARLDSKMSSLQQLIRQADRAAARLEAALAASGKPCGARGATQTSELADALDPLGLRPTSQADGLRFSDAVPRSASRAPDGPQSAAHKSSAGNRYEEIYLLADYGYTAAEIAERAAVPVGEVELILSLRDKR